MSEKNQAKSAPVAVQKKAVPKVIARNAAGQKIMKVPRGTARVVRRLGLVRNWRNVKGAKQMVPPAGVHHDNDEMPVT